MKSFSRQLCELLSFAAHKTNGKRVPCSITYNPFKTHQKLTYKCDVALQLYEYYKKHDFKYSEKGITPKALAEEIELFVRQSKDYDLSIDSFGYFHITPSPEYLHKMERQIEIQDSIYHREIVVDGLGQQQWHSQKKKIIYIPFESLNLTTLRIAFYLSLLKKKAQHFKQYKPEHLVLFMKQPRKFGEKDYRFLVNQRILNPALKTCTFWTGEKLIIEAEGKKPELVISHEDELLTGTVRHNYIPFKNQLIQADLVNGHEEIKTFGDILPNSEVTQILYDNKHIIPQILNYSLKFATTLPMNLHEQEHQEAYQPAELLEQLRNRSEAEKLLIMLDYLQDDKLVDVLALKESEMGRSDYRPFQTLFSQLSMII